MDLSTSTKFPEPDTDPETPLQTHLTRALSLNNTSLIPCHQNHPPPPPPPQQPANMVVYYKECLRNHAAKLGGLALDGCGEFMPSPSASSLDPTSLECAACGCHRNFHRRDTYNRTTVNYHPPPPPPPQPLPWNSSPSPGPTSSGHSSDPSSPASPTPQQSIYPSAPHMLLALSTGHPAPAPENHHHHHHNYQRSGSHPEDVNPYGRKRSRTKFSEEQKEKMLVFAEKLGWKMQRGGHHEKMLEEFCKEVGVGRNVFKVWMHNNKHRREKGNDHNNTITNIDCNNNNNNNFFDGNGNDDYNNNSSIDGLQIERKVHVHGSAHGSSPSS